MKLTIPIEPVAQGRPRLTTKGGYAHAYDPPKSRAYKKQMQAYIKKHYPDVTPSSSPLVITLRFYRKIPKSFSKTKTQQAEEALLVPVTKPDLDNYIKGTLDALNGIAWADDKQIVGIYASKRYSATPRTEIEIDFYNKEDTND